jgi:tripartite-type tricarboxylate transporter receptor subunit TctC
MWTHLRLLFAASALTATGAQAQQAFYAGKQITILVNYDAGGPTDFDCCHAISAAISPAIRISFCRTWAAPAA